MIHKTGFIPILISLILIPILYPIILISLLVNEILRLIVSQILEPGYTLISDDADGYYRFQRKGCSSNILGYFATPEGTLNRGRICKYLANILNLKQNSLGKLQKIITISKGFYCWKTVEDFNIENHVKEIDYNGNFGKKELQSLLSSLAGSMDEGKPQWELYILRNYDDGTATPKSLLILRLHHSFMDGMSLMIFLKTHIFPDLEYTIDPLEFKIPMWKKISLNLIAFIQLPLIIIGVPIETMFCRFWNRSPAPEPDDKRKKNFAWLGPDPKENKVIKESSVKLIRTWANVSVTNVLSLAIIKALNNSLRDRLRKDIVISEVIALLPYPDTSPHNRFSVVTYPLKCNFAEEQGHANNNLNEGITLLKELEKTRKAEFKALMGPELFGSHYIMRLLGRFPSIFSYLMIKGSFQSLMLSNAPFSRKKLKFPDGTDVLEFSAFTPQITEVGLSILTSRYDDEIKVFGVGDSSYLSEEELTTLIDRIPQEIQNMTRIIKESCAVDPSFGISISIEITK